MRDPDAPTFPVAADAETRGTAPYAAASAGEADAATVVIRIPDAVPSPSPHAAGLAVAAPEPDATRWAPSSTAGGGVPLHEQFIRAAPSPEAEARPSEAAGDETSGRFEGRPTDAPAAGDDGDGDRSEPPTFGAQALATIRRSASGPAFRAAVVGSLVALAISLVLAALLWAIVPEGTRRLMVPTDVAAARGVAALWTALHGVTGFPLANAPALGLLAALAATTLGGVVAARFRGRGLGRRDLRLTGALVGVPYAAFGLVAAVASRQRDVEVFGQGAHWRPNVLLAILACAALGAAGGVLGAALVVRRETESAVNRSPGRVRAALQAPLDALRLLATVLVAAFLASLVLNLLLAATGPERRGGVAWGDGWYALLFSVEHAIGALALGLGALFGGDFLGLPLLLHRGDDVARDFRVFDLGVAMPALPHLLLTATLMTVAYGLFVVAGYAASRRAPRGSSPAALVARWALVALTLSVALTVLAAVAYPEPEREAQQRVWGPDPGSVFVLSFFLGGLAAAVGAVLGAPAALVENAFRSSRRRAAG